MSSSTAPPRLACTVLMQPSTTHVWSLCLEETTFPSTPLVCWCCSNHTILRHLPFDTHVVTAILDAIAQHHPKVVFLTSPNNPDGSVIDEASLLSILEQPVLVVLDEAYIEFSGEPSRMAWVLQRPNLVVLRTFSKMAGLAGLRVGYGAFPAGLIEYIWRAKQPYNVSVAAEVAALAALSNMAYLEVRIPTHGHIFCATPAPHDRARGTSSLLNGSGCLRSWRGYPTCSRTHPSPISFSAGYGDAPKHS